MSYRDVYVVQPYRVGTKDRKSLAIVIPAQVVKEHSLDTSTVFALNVDKENSGIILRKVGVPGEAKMVDNKHGPAFL